MVQSTNKDGHIITVLISALPRLSFDSTGFIALSGKGQESLLRIRQLCLHVNFLQGAHCIMGQ